MNEEIFKYAANMNDLNGKSFKLDYAFTIDELRAFVGQYSRDQEFECLFDFYCYVGDLLVVLETYLCADEIPNLEDIPEQEAPGDE